MNNLEQLDNYAILLDNRVVDIVVSDSSGVEILPIIFPAPHSIVKISSDTGAAFIGGNFIDNKFRIPKPYESWIWDEKSNVYSPPIPYPKDGLSYTWDDSLASWVEVS